MFARLFGSLFRNRLIFVTGEQDAAAKASGAVAEPPKPPFFVPRGTVVVGYTLKLVIVSWGGGGGGYGNTFEVQDGCSVALLPITCLRYSHIPGMWTCT